jgi:hypothetical protein
MVFYLGRDVSINYCSKIIDNNLLSVLKLSIQIGK